MKRKHHNTEEIIRKLRKADQLAAAGESMATICQKLEISEQTMGRQRHRRFALNKSSIPLRR